MTGKVSLSALCSGAILTDASRVGGKSDIAEFMATIPSLIEVNPTNLP
jgi:hypothetical protein